MNEFQGKVAIVTGGAMGLGRALCHELARLGAAVIVADIKGEDARRVAEQLAQQGSTALATQLDVSNRDVRTSKIRRSPDNIRGAGTVPQQPSR